MIDYLRLFRKHPKPILFGAALTGASSFGQTFLVSLFVPAILEELGLTNAAFGGVFSFATLVSAALLMKTGKRVDVEALDGFSAKAAALLCAALLLLAFSFHPAMLFAALFGLRFAGQGLMSHISQTAMARHFGKSRGKALSLSALGYSAGELTLPLIFAFSIPAAGWRASLAATAILAFGAELAIVKLLPVRSFERPLPEDAFEENAADGPAPGKSFSLSRDGTFWLLAAPGGIFTVSAAGYFFYQMVMVRDRGWDPKWYALVFGAYAAARVAGIFGTGTLVDRFGARFLYPLHFFPFIAGCFAFGAAGSPGALAVYMVAMGLTMGAASVMQSAVLAETYGPAIVGTVRGAFAATMIFCSSIGPIAYGLLLDAGVPMKGIILGVVPLTTLAAAASFKTWRRPRKRR